MKPSRYSAGASLLFLLAASTPSAAQNRITNGDFEQGNSSFFSSYWFFPDDLGAGYYDVRAFPENWNPFFSSCRDHTPGNGAGSCDECFLVADGTSGNWLVWAEEFNVAPNTTYRFRYWYVSLYPWRPAEMQTWIRREAPTPGLPTLVGQDNFTINADCLWRSATQVWSSGDTTRITLYLEDVEGEENGNDFGIDDLVFYDCGPHSTSPSNVRVQRGGTAFFSVFATAGDPLGYQWQRETSPGTWVNLSNGPTGTGSTIFGATTANLAVANVSNPDNGNYRAIVTSCASIETNAASLIVARRFQGLGPLHGVPTIGFPAF